MFLYLLSMLVVGPSSPDSVVSASAEVAYLADRMGKTISVDRELSEFPIFVEANGANASALLQDIAASLHATIYSTKNGLRIGRTREDIKASSLLHRQVGMKWLQDRFELWDRDLEYEKKFGSRVNQLKDVIRTNAHADSTFLANQTNLSGRYRRLWTPAFLPAGRFLRQLVNRVGIEMLSEIGTDERRFYSNSPTAEEFRIPNADADVKTFLKEESEFQRDENYSVSDGELKRIGIPRIELSRQLPPPNEVKFLLSETRTDAHIDLRLEIYDGDGELLDQAYAASELSQYLDSPVRTAQFLMKDAIRGWVPLSRGSQWVSNIDQIRVAGSKSLANGDQPWLNLSRRTLNVGSLPYMMLYPVRFEPNNYVVRELLGGISAEYPGKAFVCQIPDRAWPFALACVRSGKANVQIFKKFLLDDIGCEETSVGSDVVIRPRDPLAADAHFAHRDVIGRSIRGFVSAQRVSLPAWSRCMKELGSGASSSVSNWYLRAVKYSLPACSGQADALAFRLLGGLSDDDWSALQSGEAVPLHDMTIDNVLLTRIVKFETIRPQSKARISPVEMHPVELFPAGMDLDFPGVIHTSTQILVDLPAPRAEPSVPFFGRTPDMLTGILLGPIRMARDFATRLNRNTSDEAIFRSVVKKMGQWRVAIQRTYTIRVQLPEGVYLNQSIADAPFMEPGTVSLDQLPVDYLKQLFEAVFHSKPSNSVGTRPQTAKSINP